MKTQNLVVLVVVLCLGLTAVLSVADDGRLALFFGVLATVVPALIGATKANDAATRLNGSLDQRIHDAVLRANQTRRQGDGNAD